MGSIRAYSFPGGIDGISQALVSKRKLSEVSLPNLTVSIARNTHNNQEADRALLLRMKMETHMSSGIRNMSSSLS